MSLRLHNRRSRCLAAALALAVSAGGARAAGGLLDGFSNFSWRDFFTLHNDKDQKPGAASSRHLFCPEVIVLDGTATAFARGAQVASFGPGDCFGELALLDNGPRTATVIADTPMRLAVVGQAEFGALLDSVPVLARRVLAGLARRVRELDARV